MLNKFTKKVSKLSDGSKSAIVYTIATLFSRGLAIITVPIFTRIMTTSEVGVVNLFNSWYSLLSVIATLSLTSGGFSVAMKEYPQKRDQYISSILSLTSGMAIVFAVLFTFFRPVFDKFIGLPNELLYLMCLGFLFAPARDFWLAKQRYEYKYKAAAFVTIISAVLATVLSILAVLYARNSNKNIVSYRLFSNYIVVFGVAAFFWVYLFVKGKTTYNRDYWKLSLSLSIPLIGHALASQVLSVSDRMMISRMVGNSEVGIYSTLYSVSSISLMIWSAMNASFIPFLYKSIDDEKSHPKVADLANKLIAFYGLIVFVCTFFAPEIVRILATEEYYEAIFIMPPIISGVFLTAISNIYSNVLLYNKKTQYIMLSTMTAAALNLILNYIFIRKYGYMAAAYTTLASYIIMAAMEILLSNVVYRMITGNNKYIYSNKKLIVIAVVTICGSLCGLFFYRFSTLRYICGLIGFCIIVFMFKNGHSISFMTSNRGDTR